MKIPKARKLPSGSWCCRVMIGGKSVTITKPTKIEAEKEAAALKSGAKASASCGKTLSQSVEQYIDDRENVLSPSTIAGYRKIARTMFLAFMPRRIDNITQDMWQREVNREAARVSAKTLKNSWALIRAVIENETGQRVTVRLPQVAPKDLPFLSPEQIPVFLAAIRGNPCEAAALLGLSSLRRSEILALRWDDIDLEHNCIRIHGAAVHDSEHKLVRKETNKNQSSTRTIPFILPRLRELAAADHPDGLVYTGNPNQIWVVVNRLCKANGLPEVGCHGLRRSYASLAYHVGMSEEVCMRTGGWADIYTMRKIYTKVSQKDIQDQAAVYQNFFSNL